MKKICLDLQPLLHEGTGINYYTKNIINKLKNENRYIGVYYPLLEKNKNIGKYRNIKTKKIKYIPYFYRKLDFIWKLIPLNISKIINEDIDIYHSFNIHIPYKINAKIIMTIHDIIPYLFPEMYGQINKEEFLNYLKSNIERADIIVTVSQHSKKEIIKYLQVNEEKIKVISPGINLAEYSIEYSEEEIRELLNKFKISRNFILFIGTLEPKKNIPNIIKAFDKYLEKTKNTDELVIAGKKGWQYEEIFSTFKNSRNKEKIKFIGYISDKEKKMLYKLGKMFVFPSIYEGFGIPVLEAMASGTPVITSNRASLTEIIKEAGILIEPNSVVSIAEAMELLSSNINIRKEIIKKGKEKVKEYDWTKILKEIQNVYSQL